MTDSPKEPYDTINHPNGFKAFTMQVRPWANNFLRRVRHAIRKGEEISDDLWENMIRYTNADSRIVIVHSKYEPSYYVVTPDTYPILCRQLIMEWHKSQWFYGAQEVAALKALKNGDEVLFWSEWNDESLSVVLEEPSHVSKEPKVYENLDELLDLAIKAEAGRKAQRKAQLKQSYESQIDDLKSKIEELDNG